MPCPRLLPTRDVTASLLVQQPAWRLPGLPRAGVQREFSPELVIDQNSTIEEGCIKPFRRSMMSGWYKSQMIQVSNHYSIPTDVPFHALDDDHKDILLYGTGSTTIGFHSNPIGDPHIE